MLQPHNQKASLTGFRYITLMSDHGHNGEISRKLHRVDTGSYSVGVERSGMGM